MKNMVLVADINSSRKIKNRGQVQIDLENVLDHLNEKNKKLLFPYTIAQGDQFVAVFSQAENIFCGAIEIMAALYPEIVRFSYGVGQASLNITEICPIRIVGDAYDLAFAGVDKMKKKKSLFSVDGLGDHEILINSSLSILSHELKLWNKNRLLTFSLFLQGKSVKDIATELNLSIKTVYKTIDVGMLKIFQTQFLEIEKVINDEILV